MNPDDSPYYSMEFVEEDGKLYVLFYNDRDKLVAKREVPQTKIPDDVLRKMRDN